MLAVEKADICVRERSLITEREGLQHWKIVGTNLCRQGKNAPRLKGGKDLRPSPPSVWLKLHAPALKLPQIVCAPTPFSIAKPFAVPLFL